MRTDRELSTEQKYAAKPWIVAWAATFLGVALLLVGFAIYVWLSDEFQIVAFVTTLVGVLIMWRVRRLCIHRIERITGSTAARQDDEPGQTV